jgi:hypothetical protein
MHTHTHTHTCIATQVVCLDAQATEADFVKAMKGARALVVSPTIQPNEEAMKVIERTIPELANAVPLSDRCGSPHA